MRAKELRKLSTDELLEIIETILNIFAGRFRTMNVDQGIRLLEIAQTSMMFGRFVVVEGIEELQRELEEKTEEM